jgi:hypothetical protein
MNDEHQSFFLLSFSSSDSKASSINKSEASSLKGVLKFDFIVLVNFNADYLKSFVAASFSSSTLTNSAK